MSVMVKTRTRLALALFGIGLASASLSGCAGFGSHESTVARGQYYASGDPYYDEFFVDLYLLQVGMAEAPKIPEAEHQRWIQLFELEPGATPAAIERRLREEALKLSRAGVHLRLDQSLVADGPSGASTVIRSNARPKENPAATLLANVETSGTNLLHWMLTMKQRQETLDRLLLMTIRLDAGVDRTFAQAPIGKLREVKENLADAHKLIALMCSRVEAVRAESEQLLAALTHGINTDNGSIGPPMSAEAGKSESSHKPGKAPDPSKKASNAQPKSRPPSSAPAARPKAPAAGGDGDEPSKPRAPSGKPAPARDFEP
ncbi:MAG TPA: hypothetical protein VJV79_35710 [Polyangiaceae bacterium]|nr:hypothetical protein [Polyangiaceae bacterium]